MPLYKKCGHPRCPAYIPTSARYCPDHAAYYKGITDARMRAQSAARHATEPWRKLYRTPEWDRCKVVVRERDGYRCTATDPFGNRCEETAKLECHHLAPAATLWHRAQGDWLAFLAMATNPANCAMLCPEHHHKADEKLRREQQGYRDQARYAPARKKNKRRRRGSR